MTETTHTNQRIAKNTLLLYFRMLMIMGVSLYISRVVLDVLGETNFGIYNVVGGFVAMFAIVSGAMTSGTQRFLSYEIGKGEAGNVGALFSTAVMIHLGLAVLILLLAETLGLWFVNTHLNIPAGRLTAANWVYQFSLLTFVVNIISVPYNAAIIAYERMKAFSYVSIIEVLLKLGVAVMLIHTTFDKLIVYAILLSAIAIFIRCIYGVYCRRNFSACRCNSHWDKGQGATMMSFASWNMIGSIANIAKEQGIDVLLNIFFGVGINAARAIVSQVMSALNGFVQNFQTAMNPQIVKRYAAGERESMLMLVFRGSKYSFMLLLTLSLPVVLEAPFILDLWLKEVPAYTALFLRIVIFTSLVDSLSGTLIASMHASGKVKEYQLVVGGISLLTLPIAWVCLHAGLTPEWAMIVGLVVAMACHFARLILLHHSIDFPVWAFLKQVTLRCLAVGVVAAILPCGVYEWVDYGWCGFGAVCLASIGSTLGAVYGIGLTAEERTFIRLKAKEITGKILRR